jgi:hypothetical protein
MAKNQSPPRGRGEASHNHTLGANFATTDLTAVSGKPAFAPQMIEFSNEGVAAEDAVYTTQNAAANAGANNTKRIPAGATIPIEVPVDSVIDTSGTNLSCIAYWRHSGGFPINA